MKLLGKLTNGAFPLAQGRRLNSCKKYSLFIFKGIVLSVIILLVNRNPQLWARKRFRKIPRQIMILKI